MRKPAVISVAFHLCVAFGLIAASMADPLPAPEEPVEAAFAVIAMVSGDLGGGNTGDIAETSTDAGAAMAPAKEGPETAPTQSEAVQQPPSVVPPTVEQLAEATPSHEPSEAIPAPVESSSEVMPPVETTTEVPVELKEPTVTAEPIVAEKILTEPVVAPEPKPDSPVEIALQPDATPPAPVDPEAPTVAPTETATATETPTASVTSAETTQATVTSGSDSALDSPSTGTGTQLAALPDATGSGSGNTVADGGGSGGDPALEPGGGGALDDAAMEDYARLLGEWLDRHKEYPDRARKRNQQGVVLCEFTMAEDGAILSHRILESSGFPLLDEEVEALFERASPLPVPPAGADLTYTVPIVFALN